MRFDSFSFSNIGGQDENQDTVGKKEKKNRALYVVADGLGGHIGGKQASQCVVDTLLSTWENAEPPEDEEGLKEWLKKQIELAQENVIKLQDATQKDMRSTVVALVISGNTAAWAHTGDSRLYYLRGGHIIALTKDHSVAFKRFEAKEITRAELNNEDQTNLLKSIGNRRQDKWEPDTNSCKLSAGDAFLLCTDGIWKYLADNEVLIDEMKSEAAEEWAMLLLLRVINRVEPDNDNLSLVTVAVE